MVGADERDGRQRGLSTPPRLVARDEEMAVLADAVSVRGSVTLIEGEAGVGKTRLLREFLADSEARADALVATCPPFREPLTLGPVVDAIRRPDVSVAELGLSGLAGALRPLFPEWSEELPALPDPAEDAAASRHRLFRALAELLGAMDVAVLVVEDVHWADDATLEFLLFLTSWPGPVGSVGLVLTYRPEDLPSDSLVRRIAGRASRRTQTRIVLAPLDVAGTSALVSSMLQEAPVSEEFARFLHERTAGIPFALEESVRLLHERADLVRRRDQWERVRLGEMQVPTTVRDAVLERVGRLSPQALEVLRAAAVLAEASDQEIVAATSGLAADDAAGGLASAVESRVLREDDAGRVSYAHMLACRAVYEAISTLERRALHLRAAAVLEVRSPGQPARLVRHLREAGDLAGWRRCAEQAADLALATGDEAAAGELLHDLATEGLVDAEVLLRVVRKLPVGTLSERYGALVDELRRALRRDGLDRGVRAQLRAELGHLLAVSEDYEAARAEIELALPDLQHDPAEAARAMTLLGWPVGAAQSKLAHLSWLERAAALAPCLESLDRLVLAVDRVTALLILGEDSGWAEAAAIPTKTSVPEERPQITRGQLNLGDLAMRWGHYGAARGHLDRASELAERHEYQRYRTGTRVTQLRLDWFSGHWRGLSARVAELVAEPDLGPLVRHEAVQVDALLATVVAGNADVAAAALDGLLDEARSLGAEQHLMEPAAALALVRLAQGRVEDALAETEEPFEIIKRNGIWIWATEIAVVRTDALIAAGLTGAAQELVATYSDWIDDRDAPAAQAALATCRAMLIQGSGDPAAAAGAFDRAAAAWESLPRPYDALLARERQGSCLLDAGRTQEGVQVLTDAHDDLTALGASAPSKRVERLLREQGVRVGRAARGGRPSYGDRLSPRESEVVQLLVDGNTNQQIADRLYLSPWTVRHHIDAAKRKLKAGSRAALAAAAVEAGVVDGVRPIS